MPKDQGPPINITPTYYKDRFYVSIQGEITHIWTGEYDTTTAFIHYTDHTAMTTANAIELAELIHRLVESKPDVVKN